MHRRTPGLYRKRRTTVSTVLFRMRKFTEVCAKLAEFCKRFSEYSVCWHTNNRPRGTHWILSPELGEGQTLTEFGAQNRTFRNHFRPVSHSRSRQHSSANTSVSCPLRVVGCGLWIDQCLGSCAADQLGSCRSKADTKKPAEPSFTQSTIFILQSSFLGFSLMRLTGTLDWLQKLPNNAT